MSKTSKISEMLKESSAFHFLEEESSSHTWVLLSLSGQAIRIYNKPSSEEIVAEFEVITSPQLITLYTYSQMSDTCGILGVHLTAPRPVDGNMCRFYLKKVISHKLIRELSDLDAELKTFCFAAECAEKYIEKLHVQSQLPNVDVSMWEGVDIQFTDIDRIVEKKSITYLDWDEFAETIFEIEMPEDHKEKLVSIIYACKKFEELNPHLNLQEVIDPLLLLLEELADRPTPKEFEVN